VGAGLDREGGGERAVTLGDEQRAAQRALAVERRQALERGPVRASGGSDATVG
jgi:hypothetical protein